MTRMSRGPLFFLVLSLGFSLSMTGCGSVQNLIKVKFGKKKQEPEKEKKEVYLGVVESVNPEQHFVLIRTHMRMAVPAGIKLETKPKTGTKALLTVTPEHKASFLSADITEGFPQRGDAVYLPSTPENSALATSAPAVVPNVAAGGAPVAGGFSPAPGVVDPNDPDPPPGVPPSDAAPVVQPPKGAPDNDPPPGVPPQE